MEKIRLSNSSEFDIVPMGIEERTNVRYFKFTSILPHDDILAIFSDNTNLATIEHIGADGLVATTYRDCVKMLVLSFVPDYKVDDNITSDIYIVTINTDAVAMALKTAQEERVFTANALDFVLISLMPMMI